MVEPRLIEQVLDSPPGRDVVSSPITQAVLLRDPESAGQLVGYLGSFGNRRRNALAVLPFYDERALAPLLQACAEQPPAVKVLVIPALYSILHELPPSRIKVLCGAASDLLPALLDEHAVVLPERDLPVEVDFIGRVCDDAFIVLTVLLEPDADLSIFRSASEAERDAGIKRFMQGLPGAAIA